MHIKLEGKVRSKEISEDYGTSIVVWDYSTDHDVRLKIGDEVAVKSVNAKDLISIEGEVDTRLFKEISNFLTLVSGKIQTKGDIE